jgi:hypothetical protein
VKEGSDGFVSAAIQREAVRTRPSKTQFGISSLVSDVVEAHDLVVTDTMTVNVDGKEVVALDYYGDDLLHISGTDKTDKVVKGSLVDQGAIAVLQPKQARNMLNNVVNMNKHAEATHMTVAADGRVVLQ